MRAAVLHEYGGSDVLEISELPDPEVGPGTVRVRVHAAGVNPYDWKLRAGYLHDFVPVTFPVVLGLELAGVVDAVGAEVGRLAVGDEVVGYVQSDVSNGAYAELLVGPAGAFVPKPENVDALTAAAVPQGGLTAAQALGGEGLAVASGETVLVHAAAGGVGTMAVQLARRAGARVIGTARDANADYLRSLGAEPVEYGEGLVERVRALAPDGVDAVLDLIGGPALDQSVELLSDRERLLSVVDPRVFELGGRLQATHPDRERLEELLGLVSQGELHVETAAVFPLDQVAQARDMVAEGHVRGKVVLDLTA
ncbi:MAG: NADP-dependent oxidoreductase [Actinomycetota bacterium]|nr:NADP-dependent oxidoreductase [Actinomycetota bacterium]